MAHVVVHVKSSDKVLSSASITRGDRRQARATNKPLACNNSTCDRFSSLPFGFRRTQHKSDPPATWTRPSRVTRTATLARGLAVTTTCATAPPPLFAALEIATGRVAATCQPHHRSPGVPCASCGRSRGPTRHRAALVMDNYDARSGSRSVTGWPATRGCTRTSRPRRRSGSTLVRGVVWHHRTQAIHCGTFRWFGHPRPWPYEGLLPAGARRSQSRVAVDVVDHHREGVVVAPREYEQRWHDGEVDDVDDRADAAGLGDKYEVVVTDQIGDESALPAPCSACRKQRAAPRTPRVRQPASRNTVVVPASVSRVNTARSSSSSPWRVQRGPMVNSPSWGTTSGSSSPSGCGAK